MPTSPKFSTIKSATQSSSDKNSESFDSEKSKNLNRFFTDSDTVEVTSTVSAAIWAHKHSLSTQQTKTPTFGHSDCQILTINSSDDDSDSDSDLDATTSDLKSSSTTSVTRSTTESIVVDDLNLSVNNINAEYLSDSNSFNEANNSYISSENSQTQSTVDCSFELNSGVQYLVTTRNSNSNTRESETGIGINNNSTFEFSPISRPKTAKGRQNQAVPIQNLRGSEQLSPKAILKRSRNTNLNGAYNFLESNSIVSESYSNIDHSYSNQLQRRRRSDSKTVCTCDSVESYPATKVSIEFQPQIIVEPETETENKNLPVSFSEKTTYTTLSSESTAFEKTRPYLRNNTNIDNNSHSAAATVSPNLIHRSLSKTTTCTGPSRSTKSKVRTSTFQADYPTPIRIGTSNSQGIRKNQIFYPSLQTLSNNINSGQGNYNNFQILKLDPVRTTDPSETIGGSTGGSERGSIDDLERSLNINNLSRNELLSTDSGAGGCINSKGLNKGNRGLGQH